MTIFQLVLLAATLIMVARQAVLLTRVNGLLARYGAVRIRPSWWLHLFATVALIIASIVSFTGIQA